MLLKQQKIIFLRLIFVIFFVDVFETRKKEIERKINKKLILSNFVFIIYLLGFTFRKGRIYLVFEYVEKNLLEVLEQKSTGLDVNYIIIYNYL